MPYSPLPPQLSSTCSPSDIHGPVVRRGAWFAALPPGVGEQLISRMVVRHLRQRELLFARGDAFDGMYCVLGGVIKLSNVHPGGRESIMALTEASQWFGEVSLFDREPRSVDARADGPSTVLHLPAAEIDRLMHDEPRMAWHLGHLLAQKMRTALLALDVMGHLSRNARMAHYLVMLATQHWSLLPECVRMRVPFQQEQIAMLMLVSRQTVGLALKDLEASGVIRRHYGHIDILDLARLTEMAELAPKTQGTPRPQAFRVERGVQADLVHTS